MAKKRFTDIEIWDKEWYMELTPTHKCLMKYIFDKCDASGCWKPNWRLASLHINATVTEADLKYLPAHQYEILPSGKIFIPDFIPFQYVTLSEKSPAHNPVFLAISKNNLSNRVFNRVLNTLQEEEEEKDKDKDKEKEEEKDAKNLKNPHSVEFNFWESHKQSFLKGGDWIYNFCSGKNIKLSDFDKKAAEFLADIELKQDYKDLKELRRHFVNWFNLQTKNNGKYSKKSAHIGEEIVFDRP